MSPEIMELLKPLGLFGALVAALVYFGPQIRTMFRRDKLDNEVMSAQIVMVDGIAESYAKRFKTQDDWQIRTEARLEEMDAKIHLYSVRVTKLTVVMLKLEGLLEHHGIPIDPVLQAEIDALKEAL